MSGHRRRHPIFAQDIRALGGTVTVHTCSDRIDRTEFFQVRHVSRGGDLHWASPRLPDLDRADAAAAAIADFTGAKVQPR